MIYALFGILFAPVSKKSLARQPPGLCRANNEHLAHSFLFTEVLFQVTSDMKNVIQIVSFPDIWKYVYKSFIPLLISVCSRDISTRIR